MTKKTDKKKPRTMTYKTFSLLAIFALMALGVAPAQAQDRYQVDFSEDLSTVTVEACFDGRAPSRLYRDSQARAFTRWIRHDGEPLRTRRRYGGFSLPSLPEDSCIQWQINLAALVRGSDDRKAYNLNGDLLMDLDLWYWNAGRSRSTLVTVNLPENHDISVPWQKISSDGQQQQFRPDRTPASWGSRMAIGRFKVREVDVAGSTLRVAAIGNLSQQRENKLVTWMKETGESVTTVYGKFPQPSPQLLVVPIGSRSEPVPWAHVLRGGGLAAEFFVDETRPLSSFRDDWTATHELSHMLFPYISSSDRWLSEGMASYYQNVLRARDGRLTDRQAWQRLDAGFDRGIRGTRGGTLVEATRSGRNATMRIYWSGAAIMLKADTQLRAATNGEQSLDTALEQLYNCCMENGKSWRARELFERLDQLTGTDIFIQLYHEHAWDDEFPDMRDHYRKLGLIKRYNRVAMDPDAPLADIRDAIMDNSSP